jgi:hypothetical protein
MADFTSPYIPLASQVTAEPSWQPHPHCLTQSYANAATQSLAKKNVLTFIACNIPGQQRILF